MISAAASAAVGSGVGVSSSSLSQGTVGAGGGWVRHAMDLEGLNTLWDIVLNASGKGDENKRNHESTRKNFCFRGHGHRETFDVHFWLMW